MDSGVITPSIKNKPTNRAPAQPEPEPVKSSLLTTKRIRLAKLFIAEVCNSLLKPRAMRGRVRRTVANVESALQDFREKLSHVVLKE